MALTNVIMRTPKTMKEAIDMDRANEFSLHTDFNIYEATVPDQMHILDLGITKYLLEFTREFLRQKLMPERSGRWIADFVRFRGIQA